MSNRNIQEIKKELDEKDPRRVRARESIARVLSQDRGHCSRSLSERYEQNQIMRGDQYLARELELNRQEALALDFSDPYAVKKEAIPGYANGAQTLESINFYDIDL